MSEKKQYRKTFWNTEFKELRNDEQQAIKHIAEVMLFAKKETGAHGNFKDMLEMTAAEFKRQFWDEEEKRRFDGRNEKK